MGNVFKHKIANFSGGLLEDKRAQSPTHFSITKNFDTFTYGSKLVPYFKRETPLGVSGAAINLLKLTRFLYANSANATTFRLFGLGQVSGGGAQKLYRLDIDGAANLDTESFVACVNGQATNGGNENVLFFYKDYLYTYGAATTINRFHTTEADFFENAWKTIDDSTIGVQPVLHPSDDIAYFFGKQIVYSLDNTTYNGAVLTLPANQEIVAACPFGNYLAIATVTLGNLDKRSTIYLWDRDSSLTTLTERIDLGECEVKHLASLENKLIAVTSQYLTNAYGLGRGKVQIKTASGTSFVTLNEITTDATQATNDLLTGSFVRDNKLYFPMKATLNGDTRVGIWAVDQNGKIALDTIEPALDANPNASFIKGIYATASMWWIAFDDGSGGDGAYSVTRTDDDSTYSTTVPSIWESLILATVGVTTRGTIIQNNLTQKKLTWAAVRTEPLPSGASIVLKYRKDTETSWTTIFTYSTVNGMQHSAVNIEADGSPLPEYNEIQFRIESYGGAVFCGMEYGGETLDNELIS